MIKNDSVRVKVNLIDSNIKWIYEDLKWISKLSEKSGQIISCEKRQYTGRNRAGQGHAR